MIQKYPRGHEVPEVKRPLPVPDLPFLQLSKSVAGTPCRTHNIWVKNLRSYWACWLSSIWSTQRLYLVSYTNRNIIPENRLIIVGITWNNGGGRRLRNFAISPKEERRSGVRTRLKYMDERNCEQEGGRWGLGTADWGRMRGLIFTAVGSPCIDGVQLYWEYDAAILWQACVRTVRYERLGFLSRRRADRASLVRFLRSGQAFSHIHSPLERVWLRVCVTPRFSHYERHFLAPRCVFHFKSIGGVYRIIFDGRRSFALARKTAIAFVQCIVPNRVRFLLVTTVLRICSWSIP